MPATRAAEPCFTAHLQSRSPEPCRNQLPTSTATLPSKPQVIGQPQHSVGLKCGLLAAMVLRSQTACPEGTSFRQQTKNRPALNPFQKVTGRACSAQRTAASETQPSTKGSRSRCSNKLQHCAVFSHSSGVLHSQSQPVHVQRNPCKLDKSEPPR